MPDIYISRAGVEEKEIVEKFTANNMKEMQEQIEKLTRQNQMKSEHYDKTLEKLQKEIVDLKKYFK